MYPMMHYHHVEITQISRAVRMDRCRYFLNLIEENDITAIFDRKRQRNATTFVTLKLLLAGKFKKLSD